MKDRLSQFLKKEGFTLIRFAEMMDVGPSTVSHIISGRNKPGFDFIEKILRRFPHLNPDWLILGVLPIYRIEIKNGDEINIPINNNDSIGMFNFEALEEKITHKENLSDDTLKRDTNEAFLHDNQLLETIQIKSLQLDEIISENVVPEKPSKKIERVIILYDNATFTCYSTE